MSTNDPYSDWRTIPNYVSPTRDAVREMQRLIASGVAVEKETAKDYEKRHLAGFTHAPEQSPRQAEEPYRKAG